MPLLVKQTLEWIPHQWFKNSPWYPAYSISKQGFSGGGHGWNVSCYSKGSRSIGTVSQERGSISVSLYKKPTLTDSTRTRTAGKGFPTGKRTRRNRRKFLRQRRLNPFKESLNLKETNTNLFLCLFCVWGDEWTTKHTASMEEMNGNKTYL